LAGRRRREEKFSIYQVAKEKKQGFTEKLPRVKLGKDRTRSESTQQKETNKHRAQRRGLGSRTSRGSGKNGSTAGRAEALSSYCHCKKVKELWLGSEKRKKVNVKGRTRKSTCSRTVHRWRGKKRIRRDRPPLGGGKRQKMK